MDEKRKKELEGMLKAVQDLKSETYIGYIGTGDAFGYLKQLRGVYERPKEIAELINRKMQDSGLAQITYKATPERLVGIEKNFNGSSFSIDGIPNFAELMAGKNPLEYLTSNFENLGFLYVIEVIDDEPLMLKEASKSKEEKCAEKVAETLYPIFKYMNERQVADDMEFGGEFLGFLEEEYSRIKGKIKRKMAFSCDEYVENLKRELSIINWEEQMSKGSLIESEKTSKNKLERLDLDITGIVGRLLRDRVDHRLEYRRMVLCKWLNDNGIEGYEDAILKCEEETRENRVIGTQLRDATSNLGKAISKLDDEKKDTFRKAGGRDIEEKLNNNVKYLDNHKEALKFIRFLLNADKNFVERYLRS
ncbi:MAG: hypothetical protein Q8N63_01910 [Nanoarchaeota archaeon]|nr:hypothetical protein [Nanoarchaeota archaeon]